MKTFSYGRIFVQEERDIVYVFDCLREACEEVMDCESFDFNFPKNLIGTYDFENGPELVYVGTFGGFSISAFYEICFRENLSVWVVSGRDSATDMPKYARTSPDAKDEKSWSEKVRKREREAYQLNKRLARKGS